MKYHYWFYYVSISGEQLPKCIHITFKLNCLAFSKNKMKFTRSNYLPRRSRVSDSKSLGMHDNIPLKDVGLRQQL
jgi:hypothetical protein